MGVSAESVPRRYTYPDLAAFPDDHMRREIVDGRLVVNPAPGTRHQRAAGNLYLALRQYADARGGEAFFAPYDVLLAPDNVVEPDLLFVRSDHLGRVRESCLEGPPDLVVEISAPSTRRLELYQRFGIPEYWYLDLDADRVEVYTLTGAAYPPPAILYPGETLESAELPGFTVPVADALAVERQGE